MQPQQNRNWKKRMIGGEIPIRGQIELSSKYLFLNALRTSGWADATLDVKGKMRNTDVEIQMFWDVEKDEKLFWCIGFHRCKKDLKLSQC